LFGVDISLVQKTCYNQTPKSMAAFRSDSSIKPVFTPAKAAAIRATELIRLIEELPAAM
jgi:hypothetical protein